MERKRRETKRAKRQRSVVVDEEAKIYARTWLGGREVRDGNVTGLSIRAASTAAAPPLPTVRV